MILLAVALTVSCAQAPARPPATIAMPVWTTVEVKPELADFYADHLATVLREDGFKVITASEIVTMLGVERQAQLLGCSDAAKACMAELAESLGAELTVSASVAKLEDTFRLHLKLIRASTGAVVSETEVEASGERALLDALSSAGHRLTEPLRPHLPTHYRRYSWIPFAGGGALVVAGVICFALAGSAYAHVQSELKTPNDATRDPALKDASTGYAYQNTGWVLIGVGVAAAALGLTMVIFGAPHDTTSSTVSLVPAPNGFGLSGSF